MSTLFDVDEVLDTVIHGDALEVLKNLPDNCVDAIVCDPPSSINFMNKSWDSDKGGRTQWVAWLSEIMREARRCLRPGGHALVWSLPRTSHWTALALEDAGFEIRDNIYNIVSGDTALHNFVASLSEEQQHAFMQVLDAQREPSGVLNIFGQGFPKSLSIDKAIDRMKGIEREIIGEGPYSSRRPRLDVKSISAYSDGVGDYNSSLITKPATPESETWAGWGSALKPSVENWWLVRKPLAAHSIAENVLEYGTGGLNIDATRVGHDTSRGDRYHGKAPGGTYIFSQGEKHKEAWEVPSGRFPSHLLLSHTLFCQQSGTKRVRGDGHKTQNEIVQKKEDTYGFTSLHSGKRHNDEDGMETVTNWICDESCPVKILDTQGGLRETHARGPKYEQAYYENGAEQYPKTGGIYGTFKGNSKPYGSNTGYVSRYFQQFPALDDVPPYIYAGKASRRDRNAGLEGLPENISHRYSEASGDHNHAPRIAKPENNTHPTVKNTALMKYLVRLVTPPNGIILDMFAGSGSTLVAAIHEGFHFIGIEKELEYITIARSRIEHAIATVGAKPQPPPAKSPTLLRPRHKTTNIQPTLWDKEITS